MRKPHLKRRKLCSSYHVHGTFGRPRGLKLYMALSAGLAGLRCTRHFRPATRAITAGAQHFRLPRRFVMPSTLGIEAYVPGTFGHTAVGTSALSARHQALSASPAGIASPALSASQRFDTCMDSTFGWPSGHDGKYLSAAAAPHCPNQ